MRKTGTVPNVQMIPLDDIVESPLNPRQQYDQAALDQLADSLNATGQITPVVVRPIKGARGSFELAAGHRRLRAAKIAGIAELMATVREMDDDTFLEVMTVEQLQHADFTPLEEASSYANLLRIHGNDVGRVAARVQKERRYVADRLRLLRLTDEAKGLLSAGRITVEHAVLLAGLTAEQQERTIADGLFVHDRGLFDEADGAVDVTHDWHAGKKPVSVPELRQWINANVLLDLAAEVSADLFPETVEAVNAAEEARRKHVFITHLRNLPPAAKGGPRIMKPGSWKDAGRKPCEYTLLGTVLIGPQRGASFHVCTATKKCETHWKDEIKASERQVSKPGSGRGSAENDRWAKEEEKREAERKKAEAERARWEKHAPVIVEAVALKVAALKLTGATAVVKELLENLRCPEQFEKILDKHAPVGAKSTAEDILRHVALARELEDLWGGWQIQNNLPSIAKRYGIDAKAMIAAAEKAEAKPSASAAAKKPAKKGGKR